MKQLKFWLMIVVIAGFVHAASVQACDGGKSKGKGKKEETSKK